jgi:hypothetical protein
MHNRTYRNQSIVQKYLYVQDDGPSLAGRVDRVSMSDHSQCCLLFLDYKIVSCNESATSMMPSAPRLRGLSYLCPFDRIGLLVNTFSKYFRNAVHKCQVLQSMIRLKSSHWPAGASSIFANSSVGPKDNATESTLKGRTRNITPVHNLCMCS